MPSLFDWSSTAGSNSTVDSINIAEGCPSGNVNGAIRSIMALIRQSFASTLQTFLAGTSPLAITNGGTGGATAAAARTALDVPSISDLASAVPAGAVFHFARNTAPSGYLVCNGAAVSRTTYATLFAAIGTTFGAGDGSTTFNLPELRGEFIRGWDNGRGIDTSRVFGAYQADELKAHTHSVAYSTSNQAWSGGGSNFFGSGGGFTGSSGGTETRPRNVALLPCIKF